MLSCREARRSKFFSAPASLVFTAPSALKPECSFLFTVTSDRSFQKSATVSPSTLPTSFERNYYAKTIFIAHLDRHSRCSARTGRSAASGLVHLRHGLNDLRPRGQRGIEESPGSGIGRSELE